MSKQIQILGVWLKQQLKWLLVAIMFVSPTFVFADISATDDFDSYTNGNNLDTLNGGSGFTGAWVVNAGTYTITTAQSDSAPNSVLTQTGGAEPDASRTFTSTTDGDEITVALRADSTANNQQIVFSDGTTYRCYVTFLHTGAINLMGVSTGLSWTTNTWYSVKTQFDYTNDRCRISVDGAAYTSYQNFNGTTAGMTKLSITVGNDAGGTHSYWFDSIAGVGTTPTTTPTTSVCDSVFGTSSCSYVINTDPNRDVFNGILLFVVGMFGTVWLFAKKR